MIRGGEENRSTKIDSASVSKTCLTGMNFNDGHSIPTVGRNAADGISHVLRDVVGQYLVLSSARSGVVIPVTCSNFFALLITAVVLAAGC